MTCNENRIAEISQHSLAQVQRIAGLLGLQTLDALKLQTDEGAPIHGKSFGLICSAFEVESQQQQSGTSTAPLVPDAALALFLLLFFPQKFANYINMTIAVSVQACEASFFCPV